MRVDHLRTLLSTPFRPRRAMSALLDGGGVMPALLLAALASFALWYGALAGIATGAMAASSPPAAPSPATAARPADDESAAAESPSLPPRLWPLVAFASTFGPIATVAGLVFLYVPATLLLVTLFDRVGSFGVAVRRDLGGLLVCTLSAFTASFLPVGLVGLAGAVPAPVLLALLGLAALGFAALMVVALQTACGANTLPALATVALSWVSFGLQGFLLFLDAHFQLGRIARREGRWEDSIRHLEDVLSRAPQHAAFEAWREAGAVYLSTGAFRHARTVLERFVENRAYDPEGLYRLGMARKGLQEPEEARALFERCVVAARTTPDHRQRDVRPGQREAEKELRGL